MKTKEKGPGLYLKEFEHSACGVGIVADILGRKSHGLVEMGLEALDNLAHRGALGADPKTGDGGGMLLQMPHVFLSRQCDSLDILLPAPGEYGVGMVFFPRDGEERAACQIIVEEAITAEGQRLLGWRDVPVDNREIGTTARESQPVIRQVFVGKGPHTDGPVAFERRLYVIRKVIENTVDRAGIKEIETFYIPSLSSNTLVYKGMLIGTQLRGFYPDLSDPDMESAFVLVHSRFSTNTLGSWRLAHPYRYIAHNGEINTLRGNTNWMVARQAQIASDLFGDDIQKLFPVLTPGASDTATLDSAIELLVMGGRSLSHVMMMLIPEAWNGDPYMSPELRAFYEYHSCLMEPWDGPALVAFTDGKRIGVTLDRNGLRPFRYTVSKENLLVMASETGVLDIPPDKVLYKGRLRPGRMFMVDPEQQRIIDDEEIKADLVARRPYRQWLEDGLVRLEDLPDKTESAGPDWMDSGSLLEQQQAFGYTREELRMITQPMAETGSEPDGSMGNDTPLAVLSDRPQLVFNYFKQLFAQVSNPPLDAIREGLVTSLEITLGSEGNLLDETPSQCRQLKLPHPILTDADLERLDDVSPPGGVIAPYYESDFGPHAHRW